MGAGSDATVAENKSLGFNLVWDVTDRLSLMFDYHDSSAEQRPDSPYGSSSLLSIAAFSRNQTTTYFDHGELPVLSLNIQPLSADDMIVTGMSSVTTTPRWILSRRAWAVPLTLTRKAW